MLNNIKLSTKIIGGFTIVLFFMIVIGFVGFSGMSNTTDRTVKADDANRIIKLVQDTRQNEKNFIIRKNNDYAKNVFEGIDKIVTQTNETKNKFTQDANKKQMDEIILKVDSYSKAFERYVTTENQKKQHNGQHA